MFGQRFSPYTSMQELNLDWLLTKVKNILRFVPDDGYVGQILRRTASGAEWSNEQGGGGAVNSVNGQTGDVVLDASDIGLGNVDNVQQYSASNPPPYPVTSVNGQTGAVTISKSDVGLGSVDNVQQYSASNPPPYPVTSVNGQTGAVTISKSDVGLGNVDNVQQYSASNPPPYPVTSVNGQTGAVVIPGTTGINCFIGEQLTTTFSIATSGFNSVSWSALGPARTLAGYTWVGWLLRCGTYRAVPIGVAGTDQLIYYVLSTQNANASFFAYPVFTKD